MEQTDTLKTIFDFIGSMSWQIITIIILIIMYIKRKGIKETVQSFTIGSSGVQVAFKEEIKKIEQKLDNKQQQIDQLKEEDIKLYKRLQYLNPQVAIELAWNDLRDKLEIICKNNNLDYTEENVNFLAHKKKLTETTIQKIIILKDVINIIKPLLDKDIAIFLINSILNFAEKGDENCIAIIKSEIKDEINGNTGFILERIKTNLSTLKEGNDKLSFRFTKHLLDSFEKVEEDTLVGFIQEELEGKNSDEMIKFIALKFINNDLSHDNDLINSVLKDITNNKSMIDDIMKKMRNDQEVDVTFLLIDIAEKFLDGFYNIVGELREDLKQYEPLTVSR